MLHMNGYFDVRETGVHTEKSAKETKKEKKVKGDIYKRGQLYLQSKKVWDALSAL